MAPKHGHGAQTVGFRGKELVFPTTCIGDVLWRFREDMSFCVVLLGDDDEPVWALLQEHCGELMRRGIVVEASGGRACIAAAAAGIQGPEWMPDRPGGVSP